MGSVRDADDDFPAAKSSSHSHCHYQLEMGWKWNQDDSISRGRRVLVVWVGCKMRMHCEEEAAGQRRGQRGASP